MNYQKIYDNLIITRKSLGRCKGSELYFEKHHIVPKCLGGSNSTANLILLTAREHYLAHWLLHRIYPTDTALSHAFWMMNFGNCDTKRTNTISSRMYAESKDAMASANRVLNTGKKVDKKHLTAWYRNKNNSKRIINNVTGEHFPNAKALWTSVYCKDITYSAFMLYIKHPDRFKGSPRNRKLKDMSILNWKYDEII
jgi:hypothetical protein